FQELGAKLILFTMRSDGRPDGTNPLTEAVEFCRARGIEFWAVNDNPDQATWTGSRKGYAHTYIHDAAAGRPIKPFMRVGGRPVVDWARIGPGIVDLIIESQKKGL